MTISSSVPLAGPASGAPLWSTTIERPMNG